MGGGILVFFMPYTSYDIAEKLLVQYWRRVPRGEGALFSQELLIADDGQQALLSFFSAKKKMWLQAPSIFYIFSLILSTSLSPRQTTDNINIERQ